MDPARVIYIIVTFMLFSSPWVVRGQQSIDGFTYIGTGYCGVNGYAHDLLDSTTIASPQECATECIKVANGNFVGFDHDGQNCRCRFDDGGLPSVAPDGWTRNAGNNAKGAITTSGGPTSRVCYRYELNLYIFAGKGFCLDSNGAGHDLVQSTSPSSRQDCATACLDFENGDFLGFDYGLVSSGMLQCKCRFADGGTPSQVPTGWTIRASNTGAGAITSTGGELYRDCYKYILYGVDPPSTMPSISSFPSASLMPSKSPSLKPSARPSISPTKTPSSHPSTSLNPSDIPSNIPTDAPSFSPSESQEPSAIPSTSPSTKPSLSPSLSRTPSLFPSRNPTNIPSVSPSNSLKPSKYPSNSPSKMPSSAPSESFEPSATPTAVPSMIPSLLPSGSLKPSMFPSIFPTKNPSLSPSESLIPSEKPSKSPSFNPSLTPTESFKPSSIPSISPTESPSVAPSASSQPSSPPSLSPSSLPSSYPSKSLDPSNVPSIPPTEAPSNSPSQSLKPSCLPSNLPTSTPSIPPTESTKPSKFPSKSPTNGPTFTPSESKNPSKSPSNAPTEIPSILPSAPPSDKPSLYRSGSPSYSPSLKLSSPPSIMPSVSPSFIPSSFPTKNKPNIEVEFQGFSFYLVDSTLPKMSDMIFYTSFSDALEKSIIEAISPNFNKSGQSIQEVKITRIGDTSFTRRLNKLSRKLENSSTEINFNVIAKQFCESLNCDDASDLAQDALDVLTTSINDSLGDSTNFLTAIKAKMTSAGIDTDVIANLGSVSPAEYNPSFVIKTDFPVMWYPDWRGSNKGCILDGNEDEYMRNHPEGYYLFDSLEACCSRHYSWNFNECVGIRPNAIGPNGQALYYPDWNGDNKGCKNDGSQPDFMSNNPDVWMFADLETCCKVRYHWNLEDCFEASSNTTTLATGSRKWYVNWEDMICMQDCTGVFPCGGRAEDWDPLYDSVEACCGSKLSWLPDCVTSSTVD